ncbi:PAQR family membrane homeostasis protein TrhA [Catellatospora sichuanensis]|uniref:PAQR family membrane homeostasis protein TrhA n=1 Tax=Catellatospora sichuanensis TaxID=1969805 RepID=UPI001181D423|nr:hemolysin III family protein [Catellatospora sichuanensis]
MRGRLHAYGFFVAAVCGVVMVGVAATRPGLAPAVSTAIYSVTVCALFAVSGLYHRRVWSERGYQLMRRLDHAMIFVFIAGTYTPLCVLLLSQTKATVMLSTVWTGALAGVMVSMIWPHAPRSVTAPLYLALGWAAVVILPEVAHVGGMVALVMLALGGIAYSVGAVLFALHRPDPWPAVFGHHEVFHACTLVAALSHHIAIYLAVYA